MSKGKLEEVKYTPRLVLKFSYIMLASALQVYTRHFKAIWNSASKLFAGCYQSTLKCCVIQSQGIGRLNVKCPRIKGGRITTCNNPRIPDRQFDGELFLDFWRIWSVHIFRTFKSTQFFKIVYLFIKHV